MRVKTSKQENTMISYFVSNASLPASDTCYNCMRCNDGDTMKLSRCSKCKLAFYCSTLCKKEHWYTTHSKHCKVLSGDEKKDGTVHDSRKCKICKDQAKKPEKYSGKAGTLVGCPFKYNKDHCMGNDATKKRGRLLLHHIQKGWDADYHGLEDVGAFNLPTNFMINLPFEHGELTGNYVDKIDETLGEMVTLAASIDLKNCEVENWFLDSEMMKIRTFYWSCLLSRHEEFFYNWFTNFNPLWVSLHQINNFIQQQKKKKENTTQLWNLLVLKYNYILAQDAVSIQKYMLKFGSKSNFIQRTQEVFRAFEDLDIFDVQEKCKTWKDLSQVKTMFSTLEGELSLSSLSIIDADPTKQTVGCSSCSLQFSTKDAQLRPDGYLHEDIDFVSASWKGSSIIVHMFSFAPFFFCGAPACKETVKDLYNQESIRSKNSQESPDSVTITGFACDHCGLHSNHPHRCSGCKSKHYCTQECQNLNWNLVHMKMCKDYKKDGNRVKLDTKDRSEFLKWCQAKKDWKKRTGVDFPSTYYDQNGPCSKETLKTKYGIEE